MKKVIIFILILGSLNLLFKKASDNYIIPKEAIRFRVIANSNTQEDQALKVNVKDSLNQELTTLLKDSNSIEESRTILKNNIPNIENNINNTLKSNNKTEAYQINYGNNYFPEKEYKGVTYPEGEYESLVVTLGEGKGENWWCVLFPPLCLLEASETNNDEVEYKFFVEELFAKFSK